MKVVEAIDVNGERYSAYEGHTKKGTVVHVDKALADLSGDAPAMLQSEILAYEDAGE